MAIPVTERKAQEYQTEGGETPFRNWLLSLRDTRAQAKITKAVTQMEAGNFGDHKPITDGSGLQERRIDYGPGYRIYYITEGDELIILFAGSDKSNQQESIDAAKKMLVDYLARKPKNRVRKSQSPKSSSKTKSKH